LDVHFAHGSSSVLMPGNHVALPDGRHVWEYNPRGLTDLPALVKAAAAEVLPDAQLAAAEQRAVPGEGARLVTTLTRHPGGASVQVHARIDESFTLVYDALVTRAGEAGVALPAAVGAGAAITAASNGAAVAPAESGDHLPMLAEKYRLVRLSVRVSASASPPDSAGATAAPLDAAVMAAPAPTAAP
ncbi:hypothetical protein, partial [Mycobacterium sp. E1715]|uniref:hypothetical protein n=1 Tax=Mycobacterium sp. E1715 TaxID=1856863 RepID=UPI001E3B7F8B